MRTVVFDLDGTLADPGDGITRSLAHALTEHGRQPPSSEELATWIGHPLVDVFRACGAGDDELDAHVASYRERYGSTGLYESRAFDGIPELLDRLRQEGRRLLVASAKPRVYVLQILELLELAAPFSVVHGSELDGRRADKRELLAHVAAVESVDAATTAMVGDRDLDLLGARHVGWAGVGVLWGHGTREELEAGDPDLLVTTPAALGRALLDETD